MIKDIQSEFMDNTHILVVDDNHINRLFFQSALEKLACDVTTADNGIDAVQKAEQTTYDLILMDIRMEGMNGIEAAKKIKKLVKNQDTPIIAVSAESFDDEENSLFETSLLKPVNQEKLFKAIEKYTISTKVFNHQKALEISHHDEKIVSHLRNLFIKQLNELKFELRTLYENEALESLQEKLHQLLGSAKICAAEAITHDITLLKLAIKNNTEDKQHAFENLMNSINRTLITK